MVLIFKCTFLKSEYDKSIRSFIRQKVLVKNGYDKTDYGFNSGSEYSYAYEKDEKLITAVDLRLMSWKKFYTFLKK
jgi:hypothetical protein